MHAFRTSSLLVGIALGLGAALGGAPTAHAVENVPNCNPVAAPFGGICNTSCKLGTDVVCQPGQQIILNNGADLDMDIYSISCAAGQDCSATAAVKMNAANSVVKATGGAETKIAGSWSSAVQCGGFAGSRVTGVRADGRFAGAALANCSKVDGNVIVGDAGSFRAVTNNGISDADFIMDNDFDGFFEDRIISLTGSRPIAVTNNVFVS